MDTEHLKQIADQELTAKLWEIDAQDIPIEKKIELGQIAFLWYGSPAWMRVKREELEKEASSDDAPNDA